jgi:hypothetical protein
MSQKINPEQLQNYSLEEIKAYKADTQKRKTELETLKAKGGKAWTPELQEELDSLALLLVDVDDAIEEKAKAEEKFKTKAPSYTPEPGTEQMVHLSIVQGRRFNPLTGKEESKAFTQLFTFGEWQLFKKHYKSLGFTVLAVLHDPYGDAAEIVTAK